MEVLQKICVKIPNKSAILKTMKTARPAKINLKMAHAIVLEFWLQERGDDVAQTVAEAKGFILEGKPYKPNQSLADADNFVEIYPFVQKILGLPEGANITDKEFIAAAQKILRSRSAPQPVIDGGAELTAAGNMGYGNWVSGGI